MGNRWKGEISRPILNIFRPYNRIDVLKLPFLEELCRKAFVVPYVISLSGARTDDTTCFDSSKSPMKMALFVFVFS